MVIRSKYTGTCKLCGGKIRVGEEINWARGEGSSHVKCPDVSREPSETEAPYKLHGGSGYGFSGWSVGQTIKSSDRHVGEGWPEFVTVVLATKRYVREDGMSFGVGDESGYIYSAKARAATDDEIAPVKARIAEAEAKKTAKAELEALKQRIIDTGERPDGDNSPEGERLFDTQNIYGGGDWFVVGPEWIWYVRNNGADGDNWSGNNVRTGGAGGIGWRIPVDQAVIENLSAIGKTIGGAA